MAEAEKTTGALIEASRASDLERVRGLTLDGGVSLNAEDRYGRRALLVASEEGKMTSFGFSSS
jgi:hypothetical protein